MSDKPWSQTLREQAVTVAHLAEEQDRLTERFRRLAAKWPDEDLRTEEMVAKSEAAAYRLRTLQLVHHQQAQAYDEMIAAGGRDNAESYAAYTATTDRNRALLPDLTAPGADLDR